MYKKIDLLIDDSYAEAIDKITERKQVVGSWRIKNQNHKMKYVIILRDEDIEIIRDEISKVLKLDLEIAEVKDVKNIMMVESVEGFLPKIQEIESADSKKKEMKSKKIIDRISIDEMHEIVSDGNSLSHNFLINVILASIVCSIGIIKEDTAVLIVSSTIAPFFGAIIGYSFGISIGDSDVIKKSLKTMIFGFLLSLTMGILTGFLWNYLPETYNIDTTKHIFHEMNINRYTFVLALASGASASLAITSGLSTIMASFMISAAILPNITISGILISNGFFEMFFQSFLLLIINIVSIIFTSQLIFMFKKVNPKTKKAIEYSKDNKHRNIIILSIFLIILSLIKFYRN